MAKYRKGVCQTGIEPTPYKADKLPEKPRRNTVYYVLNSNSTISMYVTDKKGTPIPVGTPINMPSNFVSSITSPNGTIDITTLGDSVGVDISQNILDIINGVESDKHFTYVQNTPESVWIITHNLNKKPAPTVTDSAGNIVEGDINYIDLNTIKITFNGAFTGEAHLN